MMKLDIGYDPQLPDDWQGNFHAQAEYEAALDAEPRPWWPYDRGRVSVLGINFVRKSHRTGGADPYAGESWTARFGPLEIRLCNLVCDEGEIFWRRRRIVRVCDSDPKRMPRWWRTLWEFLEGRYRWWERRSPDDGRYYE